jgi:hypothetical protein
MYKKSSSQFFYLDIENSLGSGTGFMANETDWFRPRPF